MPNPSPLASVLLYGPAEVEGALCRVVKHPIWGTMVEMWYGNTWFHDPVETVAEVMREAPADARTLARYGCPHEKARSV